VANLRAENATLRGKYQSILAEQNDVLDEKHTQHVNHLMNLKYEIEEQVEGELERFDQLKRQLRLLSSKVKNLTLADKSNLYDEREHERTRKKHEDKVEMWKLKHSEEVTHGKALRVVVDDLRHDKMNVKRKIQGKTEELAARSAEAVQLINIANEFYSQRQRYRLVASDLIAEAGKEAEEHRAKMQEISNRIDYYDLVMQEREEDYQKMLLDAERQAANLNDPSEEMKEAEKKRQQELVEAFDKLMYASGVWDVDELVTRFLRKEEKMSLAKNYLDALTEDAEKIERDIKTYRDEASSLLTAKPEEEAAVVALKENISAVEAKSAGLRQQTEQTFQMLEEVGHVLGVIKKRMAACPALDLMRPVKRRWALLRANLQRVPLIAQRPRVDASKVQQGLSKAPPAKFDPRRKTILEELTGDAEAGSNGVEALTGD
jgi:DNA repair exonuclease SbcCD ATPase subunit